MKNDKPIKRFTPIRWRKRERKHEPIQRRKGDTDERSLSDKCRPALDTLAKKGDRVKELPKFTRIVDQSALDECSARTHCERCGYSENLSNHHIKTRGSGGGDQDWNLLRLCFKCHRGFHDGRIKREPLQEIADAREKLLGRPTSGEAAIEKR